MYKVSKTFTKALEGALITGIAGGVAASNVPLPDDVATTTAALVSALVGFAIAFVKNWLKNRGRK